VLPWVWTPDPSTAEGSGWHLGGTYLEEPDMGEGSGAREAVKPRHRILKETEGDGGSTGSAGGGGEGGLYSEPQSASVPWGKSKGDEMA